MAILSTFRKYLFRDLIWSILAAVSMQGSVLLSGMLAARVLGLSVFGKYALLVTTVTTAAAIAQSGAGSVVAKFVAEYRVSEPHRIGTVLWFCQRITVVMGLIAVAVLLFGAPVFATSVFKQPDLEPVIRLVAPAIFFQVMVTYQQGALQGFAAFKTLGRISTVSGLVFLVLPPLGAKLGGLDGAALGFVVASLARSVFFYIAVRVTTRDMLSGVSQMVRRDDIGRVLHFLVPAGLASVVTLPCIWLVSVFLARAPNGLEMVAIFSVATQLRMATLQLPTLLNSVTLSVMNALFGQRSSREFRNVFRTTLIANGAFLALAIPVLVACSSLILGLYGHRFADGRRTLILLLVSVIPEILAATVYHVINTFGRMWLSLFFIITPVNVSYTLIAAWLIPTMGVEGAALAYVVAQVLYLIATIIVARLAARDHALKERHPGGAANG
ncbi:oligosaccharide flippase family protein [Ralstonia soli]|uniref:Oligosaccharide flippase family protein n=1 Tax=Ralstonia soli TaxID=2953896 RepID=A0ABT1AJJ4_9RALS|nr:oligosaccharide flippase family protein [Ralstonia soli]MCO5398478.1 oligosaccharide flippase family protein [Ralstonia soli]